MRTLLLSLLLVAAALWMGIIISERMPVPPSVLPARTGPALADAKTWGYQLQKFRASQVPREIDMLVVDYTNAGGFMGTAAKSDVDRLRIRPDRPPRIVLCYLSIGEAENYRPYWRRSWSVAPPAWLGPENAAWKGNFPVRYWDRDWQNIIVGTATVSPTVWDRILAAVFSPPKPYIDQIIDAGFDGIYLDRVDAYEKPLDRRPTAKSDMVSFVETISTYAKTRRPGFLVVPQNGESLLAAPRYRRAIDAVAKEDLLYGEAGDGIKNPEADVKYSTAYLNRVKSEGRPVFVVEYLASEADRAAAADELRRLGYVAVFTERGLATPPVVPALATKPSP